MNYYKVQIRISLKKISQSEIKLFKIIIMDKMISMIMSKIKIQKKSKKILMTRKKMKIMK